MMKVLILEDDPSIREVVHFTLESFLDAEFLLTDSALKAIDIVKENLDLDLIVSDYDVNEGTGGDLFRVVQKLDRWVPFVLVTGNDLNQLTEFSEGGKHLIKYVQKPNIFEGLKQAVALFQAAVKESKSQVRYVPNKQSYIPIDLSFLHRLSRVPGDLFIKLSDEKFLKVVEKESEIDADMCNKFNEKKIECLYVKFEDVSLFVKYFENIIASIVNDANKTDSEKTLTVQEVMQEVAVSFGLSDTIVECASQNIEMISKQIKDDRVLSDVLISIFADSDSYVTKHSVALVYVSTAIAMNSPHCKDDVGIKVSYAALIHDTCLPDKNIIEFEFSKEDSIFKQHGVKASEFVTHSALIPDDVDRIILEHHERPDGSGIPRGLSGKKISLLSAFFILSHDVVDEIFKIKQEGGVLTMEVLLKRLPKDKYSVGHFSKAYEALEKTSLF